MAAQHFRLVCRRTIGRLSRHVLDATLPTLDKAVEEMVLLQQIGWDSVSLTPAPEHDTIRTSVTGTHRLASGRINLPKRKGVE